MNLKVLDDRFEISRVDEAPLGRDYWAVIHDHDGWTVVAPCETGIWKAIQVDQEFGLDEIGVLLQLLQPLAEAKVPIMAYSSYRTDYLFVKMNQVQVAVEALVQAGHKVVGNES